MIRKNQIIIFTLISTLLLLVLLVLVYILARKNDEKNYTWAVKPQDSCSRPCGGGNRFRDVWCKNTKGAKVAEKLCKNSKPDSHEDCNMEKCCHTDNDCDSGGICNGVKCIKGGISSDWLETAIKEHNINPQKDILLNSKLYTWDNLVEAMSIWNKTFKGENMEFPEGDTDEIKIKTLCAFLGNARWESADFEACREHVQPCDQSKYKCSNGTPPDYTSDKWGACYSPNEGNTDPDACGRNQQCTDFMGRPYKDRDCFFGRGAIQLTWACNYYKTNVNLKKLGHNIDICKDPDSVCDDGVTLWLSSINYWVTIVGQKWLQNMDIYDASFAIKGNEEASFTNRALYYKNYISLFGLLCNMSDKDTLKYHCCDKEGGCYSGQPGPSKATKRCGNTWTEANDRCDLPSCKTIGDCIPTYKNCFNAVKEC